MIGLRSISYVRAGRRKQKPGHTPVFVVWTYSGFLRSRGGSLERPCGLESRYRLADLYSNQPFLSTLPNVSRIPKEKTATSERWGWPFLAVVGPAWAMTWR